MRAHRIALVLSRPALAALAVFMLHIGSAAGAAPSTLVLSRRIGWEADARTGANVCTVASHDECRSRVQSTKAGGFDYPDSVANDPRTDNMYVAEIDGDRVQVLTAAGAFVSMFGWDVNETEDHRAGAGQTEQNLCTAASKDLCTVGVAGSLPGQLDFPASVAVDPLTGEVYVLELGAGDFSVEKYTREGHFVWRLGKDVNRVTKGDFCSAQEVARTKAPCRGGVEASSESSEHGAFKFANQSGNLLAVDPRTQLLYVGDEHRVQIFSTDGQWHGEIPLVSLSAQPYSSVVALALNANGDLDVVYRVGPDENYLPSEHANVIHEFDLSGSGEQISEYPISARSPEALDSVEGMAVTGSGRMALVGVEVGAGASGRFGLFVDFGNGLTSEFTPPPDNEGIGFDNEEELYITTAIDHTVAVYAPAPLAAALNESVPCERQIENESLAAMTCPEAE